MIFVVVDTKIYSHFRNGALSMALLKPFHVTAHGGSIHCLEGLSGRIFRACSSNQCTYTRNLYSAKTFLDSLENNTFKLLPFAVKKDITSVQRKTTLKWNYDGSLSSVDMARILSLLKKDNLTECELSCEWGISQ